MSLVYNNINDINLSNSVDISLYFADKMMCLVSIVLTCYCNQMTVMKNLQWLKSQNVSGKED